MIETCPKCGAKREELINITDSVSFECGTDFYPDRNNLLREGYGCLQRQIVQQAELLGQATGEKAMTDNSLKVWVIVGFILYVFIMCFGEP